MPSELGFRLAGLALLFAAAPACREGVVAAAEPPALDSTTLEPIVLERIGGDTHELGNVLSGTQQRITVEAHVVAPQGLLLSRAVRSCGCTAVTPYRVLGAEHVERLAWGARLAKGERLRLELDIDFTGKAGGFHSRVDLLGDQQRVVFTHHVRASVERALYTEPRAANFGELRAGETGTLRVALLSDLIPSGLADGGSGAGGLVLGGGVGLPVQHRVRVTPSAGFAAEVLPRDSQGESDPDALALLALSAGPFDAPGMHIGELELVVEDATGAAWQRHALLAYVEVGSAIDVRPERLAFGLVEPGAERRLEVDVRFGGAAPEGEWVLSLRRGSGASFSVAEDWRASDRCVVTVTMAPAADVAQGVVGGDLCFVVADQVQLAIPVSALLRRRPVARE